LLIVWVNGDIMQGVLIVTTFIGISSYPDEFRYARKRVIESFVQIF
jgi:hypothetical protein